MKQFLTVVAVGVLGAVLLIACGGGQKESNMPAPSGTETAAPTGEATGEATGAPTSTETAAPAGTDSAAPAST